MNRITRILFMTIIFTLTFFSSLYIITVVQSPLVTTISGSEGETTTNIFTITKNSWDIKVTYFKSWSIVWSLRIQIYAQGKDGQPLFSTAVLLYTFPDGRETVELISHPSLSTGNYYLKIYSRGVDWTVQVIEWN